jgi:conjugal transfer ATP-binding protein TraC
MSFLMDILASATGANAAAAKESLTHPASIASKHYQKYSFSKYLPIVSYDPGDRLYRCNNDDYGVVFEMTPRIVMGPKTADFLIELLNKIPEDVYLQISYIGSKNILQIIDAFNELHRGKVDSRLGEKALKNITEFMWDKTNDNISPTINCYLKNTRVLITARGKVLETIKSFGILMENTMSSNSFAPQRLSPDELKPIFYELCNGHIDFTNIPDYSSKIAFNRQCVSKSTVVRPHDDTIEFLNLDSDGNMQKEGKHWVALAPTIFPEEAYIGDFGQKLGDYISPAMNINQFKDTFIITTTYARLGKTELGKITKRQFAIEAQRFPSLFTKFWKKKSEALSIKDKLDNKATTLLFDMTIMVSGKDKMAANANATTIQSFWNKGGSTSKIVLERILGVPHIAFLQSLPLGCSQETLKVTDNYAYNFAEEVAQFIPLEADWKGSLPNFLVISRRGQLTGIDLFETQESKNGYIVATSGAGKSVWLQNLSFYSYLANTRVYIIDIGGSYEKLCKTLNGEYIEIDHDNPISFNPFSKIQSLDDLNKSMPFFQDFIYMLGASKNLGESQKDEKYIKSHIVDAIRRLYSEYGNKMELTHIKDFFDKQDDDRQKQFARHLHDYSRGGVHGKFFEGVATVNLDNPFAVLEVGKVEEQADIRDAIIFVMIFHISQKVYVQNDNTKTQVIIDEAHKFLGKNPRMDDFVDQAYRRFRKHNASILMATQGFDDIYNRLSGGLSRAGQTIINNSPWKIFLKQTETSINLLIESKVFNFSPVEEDIMRSIHTQKGEYSEFLLINPSGHKIPYRLVIDRFFYYLTTTDPKDKQNINETMQRLNCSLEEAIDYIVQHEKQKNQ